jgi:hypothetical protein
MRNPSAFLTVSLLGAAVIAGACSSEPTAVQNRQTNISASQTTDSSMKNVPALYDGKTFMINLKLEPPPAQGVLINRKGLNNIYECDMCEAAGVHFTFVIDAIPTDGMNPHWLEQQITFTAGHAPRQLQSDNDVAAAVSSGEITLTSTGQVYRCSVTGKP